MNLTCLHGSDSFSICKEKNIDAGQRLLNF